MPGVRFAPSPTGLFHIGNLRTAWVAKRLSTVFNEPFVVRVEDIDSARVVAGIWNQQLEDLNFLKIVPDRVYFQTTHHQRHQDIFNRARVEGVIYPCDCSRKDVADALRDFASAPHDQTSADHPVYTGHCRDRESTDLSQYHATESLAWRWRRPNPSGILDPIVARTTRSGTHFSPGYHWACAIDDADGDYRVLVRSWDLAPSEPIQSEIRKWVQPKSNCQVFHTTLITRNDSGRIEKRSQGVTLKELWAAGISTQTLLALFNNSFDLESAMRMISNSSEGVMGENAHTRRIGEIMGD